MATTATKPQKRKQTTSKASDSAVPLTAAVSVLEGCEMIDSTPLESVRRELSEARARLRAIDVVNLTMFIEGPDDDLETVGELSVRLLSADGPVRLFQHLEAAIAQFMLAEYPRRGAREAVTA